MDLINNNINKPNNFVPFCLNCKPLLFRNITKLNTKHKFVYGHAQTTYKTALAIEYWHF